ncbi:MAG: 2-C-methyl-D-erythritol 4-phosphate cytidylyltransferase, partial [Smithellaceae bacterium]|nr:2-C-methyl-D-erythritol 4-phosphate cytidylyltransferase [Smithellaceae bacterium]
MAIKTVAIIPAGGAGTRLGGERPKQFQTLADLPLVVHGLLAFQSSPAISAITLVCPSGDLDFVKERIVDAYGITKATKVLAGGKERQDSVREGIKALEPDCEIVVIHDGARPLVTPVLIERSVDAAWRDGAVTVGVPVCDTVKEVDGQGLVVRTVSRAGLWLVQTPQAFQAALIREAYRQAYSEGYYATDDATLVERMGKPVRMIMGDHDNIKVTTREDLSLAEK